MTAIEPFIVPEVRIDDVVAIMEVMEDMNPIHVDLDLAKSLGLRGCVNQGPANLGYVTNMLINWAGSPRAIRHMNIRFQSVSCPGDRLEARGTVIGVNVVDGSHLATCEVALVRPLAELVNGDDVEYILQGTATVEIPVSVAESIGAADAS